MAYSFGHIFFLFHDMILPIVLLLVALTHT